MLSCQQVTAIDVAKKKNLKFSKHVSLGYSTRAALQDANASQLQLECFNLEKGPLKNKPCKGLSFCDPTLISKLFETSLGSLEVFQEGNWLSGNEANRVERDFRIVCASPAGMESVKKKAGQFLEYAFSGFSVPDLLNFVKKVLILSHGNFSVQRGFSVNKELIVENQAQKSIVTQRQVYDEVVASGGLHDLKVCKKMIHCSRNARGLFGEALRLKDFHSKDKKQEVIEKKRICERLKKLSAKRKKDKFVTLKGKQKQ
ncbi:hypothetical protein PR048_023419 [Dryococelus australis]|uniref:Uncharacterized protein n=1 Tax=Dryococelus australis TaxID=614101 RepID=A0ABQ9GU11_9NEOP|nr:hypothetical protein PR048_023419 [Dryococelus australis]